jgi:hypothetical protein
MASVVLVALFATACGGGGEVEEGAAVTVYAGASVCAGARMELGRSGARGGDVRVEVFCMPPVGTAGRLDLAATGANARRAVEDSRTVGYLEAPGRSTRFLRPILEEPEIALTVDSSGAHAMSRILDALRSRDSSESPRESVWNAR